MNAGRLRYKVRLNIFSQAQDNTYGSILRTEATHSRWADMRFELIGKTVEGGIYTDRRKCFFFLRKDSTTETLTERDTITYSTTVFQIQKISHRGLGNDQWVEVETIEKQ